VQRDRLLSYINHLGEERIRQENEYRKTAKEKQNSLVEAGVEIPGTYAQVRALEPSNLGEEGGEEVCSGWRSGLAQFSLSSA